MSSPSAGVVKNCDTAKRHQVQCPGPVWPIRRPDTDCLPEGSVSIEIEHRVKGDGFIWGA